jgi:hypothetical protein
VESDKRVSREGKKKQRRKAKQYFYRGATALVGQGLFIIEASRSHSYTQHAVELLWTSDQLDRDLYLTINNTQNNRHPCLRRDWNPQTQQASGPRTTS